jgi:hypothetical protein
LIHVGEVDERRRAKINKRHNLRGWLHDSCARVCVYACVDQFRACVYVGAWVDAGLCVPMTVRSANNAIGTILKLDCFSGRTADLQEFLHSWGTVHAVRVALVGRISVYLYCDVTKISRQRQQEEASSPRLHLKDVDVPSRLPK